MGLQFDGDNISFSAWQIGRIRARLISYYYVQQARRKKAQEIKQQENKEYSYRRDQDDDPLPLETQSAHEQEGISWKSLAQEIVFLDDERYATNIADYIDWDKYDGHDDLHNDNGLPIRGENLRKFYRGESKPKDGFKIWITPAPEGNLNVEGKRVPPNAPQGIALPAIYAFLRSKGFLQDSDMIEPDFWPKSIDPAFIPEPQFTNQKLPFFFCNDYKTDSDKENEFRWYGHFYTKESNAPIQCRFVEIRPKDSLSSAPTPDNTEYYWGYLYLIDENFGVMVNSVHGKPEDQEKGWLLVRSNIASKEVQKMTFVHQNVYDFLSLSPTGKIEYLEKLRAKNENAKEGHVTDLHITFDPDLTPILLDYNIMVGRRRRGQFLFSTSSQEDSEKPEIISREVEEVLSGVQSSKKIERSGNIMKLSEITGKPEALLNDVDPVGALDINEITDPELLGRRLLFSCSYGESEDVPILLAKGVDVNYVGKENNVTALALIMASNRYYHLKEIIKADQIEGIPNLDYLEDGGYGFLNSQAAIEQEYINPAMLRFVIKKEMQQAEERGLDYDTLVEESIENYRIWIENKEPFDPNIGIREAIRKREEAEAQAAADGFDTPEI